MDTQQIQQLPGWFRATKIGHQLETENAKLETQARQKIVDEIAQLRADAERKLPALRKAAVDAFAKEQEAERVLDQARKHRIQADAEEQAVSTNTAAAALEMRLRSEVADEIRGYRDRVLEQLELTRKSLVKHQEATGKIDGLSLTKIMRSVTNQPSVVARIAALTRILQVELDYIALLPSAIERQQKFEAALAASPAISEPVQTLFGTPIKEQPNPVGPSSVL